MGTLVYHYGVAETGRFVDTTYDYYAGIANMKFQELEKESEWMYSVWLRGGR